MRALSIMQPWAWLIVNGHKAIENRNWRCRYRGPVLIHAGKKADQSADISMLRGWHPVLDEVAPELTAAYRAAGQAGEIFLGGIVGEAEIVDCVEESDDTWFVGRFGIVLRNAKPLPFRPCRGALGFFTPTFEEA